MGLNEFIKHRIGEEYLYRKAGVEEETPFVKAAFAELSKVNRELFKLIPFPVVFTDEDMYSSAKEMRERVQAENVIYIYTGYSGHPYLNQEDNNISRAVHDVFAHLVCGCSFSFEGELAAYYEQRNHYPEWTWNVLFAEVVGQTSAYYANGQSHDFNQRAIVAPEKWMLMAANVKLPDFSKNSIMEPYKNVVLV
jgi:hypothetical protein